MKTLHKQHQSQSSITIVASHRLKRTCTFKVLLFHTEVIANNQHTTKEKTTNKIVKSLNKRKEKGNVKPKDLIKTIAFKIRP